MHITDIRLRHLTGHMPVDGPFFEDRLLQPTDIYDEFRVGGDIHPRGQQLDSGTFEVQQVFVQIDTDAGVSGICGGMFPGVPWHVWQLRDLLIGPRPVGDRVPVGHHAPDIGARQAGRANDGNLGD